MARLPNDGRNHYAALRNPPADWTLRTKTDRVIGGPLREAATVQQKPQVAATLRQHEVGRRT